MNQKEYIFIRQLSVIDTCSLLTNVPRMFFRSWLIVFLEIGTFFLVACNEVPCTRDPGTVIGIEFCDKAAPGVVPKKYPVSRYVVRNNQLFIDTLSQTVSGLRFRLPSNSDAFWLSFSDSTSKDSVRFSYSRTMEFAGESCGFYYGFKDLMVDSVAGMNFERAQILINQGDSSNKVHVRIFW